MNDLSAVTLHLASSPSLGIIRAFSFSFNLSHTPPPLSQFCSDSSHTFPPVQLSVLLQIIIGFSECDSELRQHCFISLSYILFSWLCFRFTKFLALVC